MKCLYFGQFAIAAKCSRRRASRTWLCWGRFSAISIRRSRLQTFKENAKMSIQQTTSTRLHSYNPQWSRVWVDIEILRYGSLADRQHTFDKSYALERKILQILSFQYDWRNIIRSFFWRQNVQYLRQTSLSIFKHDFLSVHSTFSLFYGYEDNNRVQFLPSRRAHNITIFTRVRWHAMKGEPFSLAKSPENVDWLIQ